MERLRSALVHRNERRFQVLFGDGIADHYISADYRQLHVEEALVTVLQELNYRRIVFFSPHLKVYFRDHRSRDLSRPQGITTGSGRRATRAAFQGPLGARRVVEPPPQQETAGPSEMGVASSIRLLDLFMRDATVRTAVVFQQAETSAELFNDPEIRSTIGAWDSLPPANRNISIWLFPANSNERLREVVRAMPLPELRAYVDELAGASQRPKYIMPVGGPEAPEMERLLDYARLTLGFRLSPAAWVERPRLMQHLAAENIRATDWLIRFDGLSLLDRATVRQWLSSSVRGDLDAQQQLEQLIGLSGVKELIREQAAVQRRAFQLRQQNPDFRQVADNPHMIFTGNPGTGKTTVARLVGEIYRDIDRLKRGHVVSAEAKDLVAGHVGGTAIKTNDLVDQALDGVLFIDEAYRLTEEGRGEFGREAVDTLLTRMENDRDRLVVIAAGYVEPMRKFRQANPGLIRRFPEENIIPFPDYTPGELMAILRQMLMERQLRYDAQMEELLEQIVDGMYSTRNETFGNAGDMRNLADALARRQAARTELQQLPPDAPLDRADIHERYRIYLRPPVPLIGELLRELNGLVGLGTVKSFVREQLALLQDELRRGRRPQPGAQHMVYYGPPGTGKTTVARLMGRIFKDLGLLRKGHVVEVSRADLVGAYVGHSEQNIRKKIEDALDGVLFIDEAYSLTREQEGGFGQGVVDVLTQAMENYRDRLVIIAAGYEREMNQFLSRNSGLESRFSERIRFPSYTPEELLEITRRMAAADGSTLSRACEVAVSVYLAAQRQLEGERFGNARTVRNMLQVMKRRRAVRLLDNPPTDTAEADTYQVEDLPPLELPTGANPDATSHRSFDIISRLPPAPPQPPARDDTRRATGYVSVRTPDANSGSGSGFAVTPDGYFLTSYHVVSGASQVTVRMEGEARMRRAELVGWDGAADLAVLKLEEGQYPWLALAEQGYRPSYGEEVVAWGWPLGEQLGSGITFFLGRVTAVDRQGANGEELIQMDTGVTYGTSGGPLLRNGDLRVIGVIQGGMRQEGPTSFNFAVSIQELYRRLGGSQAPLAPAVDAAAV